MRARFLGGVTDDELASYEARVLDLLRRCDARGERFALVTDGENAIPLSGQQRRMQASFVARHRELAARIVAGNAIVLNSPMHRAVVQVILWLASPPYPLVVVGTLAEAEARARAFLSESGAAEKDASDQA